MKRLLWPAAVVLGLSAEWAAGFEVADLLTGWTLIACGLLSWPRGSGKLLTLTGALWFAGNFAAEALYLYRGPLVHLLLAYPRGRAPSRVAVAAGYGAAVVPAVWASEPATLALCALLPFAVARGRRGTAGEQRRARTLALTVAAGLAVVLAGGAVARLAFPAGEADDAALLALELALCGAAIVLAAGPRVSPAVTDLVVELGESRSPTLRDALAEALGDPTLDVGYRTPDGYRSAAGRTLATDGRSVTFLEGDQIALVHDRAVLDDPLLVDAVDAAARMASANAALQAELRTQVDELEASRRRIVLAGTEQRQELEQRLQDGALRRLDELRALLQGAPGPRVERAAELLVQTRSELEALARGLHPRDLAGQGLTAALSSLAAAGPVPVALSVTGERLPAEHERVVYFVCAEALANVAKHAHATQVAVTVEPQLVLVDDDGVGGADRDGAGLRGLADRVEALGGQLQIDSPVGGGTRLTAQLPR